VNGCFSSSFSSTSVSFRRRLALSSLGQVCTLVIFLWGLLVTPVGPDVNRMLQLFFCYACEESYEPFAPSVLVRFVPLPPAVPAPGQELPPALLADIAANEDAAVQLSKRPRDDEQRSEGECKFPKGHFPFKKLVNWVPREDWPHLFERQDIAAAEGIDPADDLPTPEGGCKLGGWAEWTQGAHVPLEVDGFGRKVADKEVCSGRSPCVHDLRGRHVERGFQHRRGRCHPVRL
jgi:hypothetical protein